jgi:hypothetical protein
MYGYKVYDHEVRFIVRRNGGWSDVFTIRVRTKQRGRIADLVLGYATRRIPELTRFDVYITGVYIV